ncbi:hypothetical protein GEMRC1_003421 [Eukaryota sp. GEM-RC1]
MSLNLKDIQHEISQLVKTSDITKLTLKSIKQHLRLRFGEQVDAFKVQIKALVIEACKTSIPPPPSIQNPRHQFHNTPFSPKSTPEKRRNIASTRKALLEIRPLILSLMCFSEHKVLALLLLDKQSNGCFWPSSNTLISSESLSEPNSLDYDSFSDDPDEDIPPIKQTDTMELSRLLERDDDDSYRSEELRGVLLKLIKSKLSKFKINEYLQGIDPTGHLRRQYLHNLLEVLIDPILSFAITLINQFLTLSSLDASQSQSADELLTQSETSTSFHLRGDFATVLNSLMVLSHFSVPSCPFTSAADVLKNCRPPVVHDDEQQSCETFFFLRGKVLTSGELIYVSSICHHYRG